MSPPTYAVEAWACKPALPGEERRVTENDACLSLAARAGQPELLAAAFDDGTDFDDGTAWDDWPEVAA